MKKMNRIQLSRGAGTLLLVLCAAILTAPTSLDAAAPCPDFPVDLTFRDAPGDAVRSDGRVTYFNLAEMDSCSGGLGVIFFGPFNFQLVVLGETAKSANGNVVFEIGTIDDVEITGGYLGMAVGTVQTTKVQFNFVVGSTRHYLAYWEDKYPLPASSDITVTRVDENTWIVEALPGAHARVLSTTAKGKAGQTALPYTQSAPFHLTLTKHF